MSATYRLQLRGPSAGAAEAFTFADAEAHIDYFAQLGVSHLYLSPIMTCPPDSMHGYDITDPTTVNPELGGFDGFRSFSRKAHEAGLKILLDIVPNHVGVEVPKLNPWWWDVLTHGKESEYARYFDIDWSPANGAGGKLGLPVLGDPQDLYDENALRVEDGELRYYEHAFPLAPGTEGGTAAEVHDRQHYKLMYWRDGIINYRRFFSINGLAGLRQEDPVVFEHSHRILGRLFAEGLVDGVRVDHPDGLADPFGYLTQLRALIGPDRWLLVEKILEVDEPLDPRLSVDGTTGYDALREFDGVFVHRPAVTPLSDLALEQTGNPWDAAAFRSVEQDMKANVARFELAAEIRRLAAAVRSDNWSTSGEAVDEDVLQETLIALISAMPVYRGDYESLSKVTSATIARLIVDHPRWNDALDLIATALISRGEAFTRFAQVCGAVMAKGVEDTTFYRGSRLVSLQEVGGNPGRFGVSPAEFHLLQEERSRLWPRTLTSLTTHDTKRGEDVRARITVLTEVPQEFAELCRSIPYPDGTTCHFLLPNILGAWPTDEDGTGAWTDFPTRIHDYATKAMREAGLHTTWFDVNEDFENSIHEWIDELLDGRYREQNSAFVHRIAPAARQLSNSKKLLQLMAPGVPDIYQGTEFHTDYLVDPDNRRPVDYGERAALLDKVSRGDVNGPDAERLSLISTALQIRRIHDLDDADYLPVMARGDMHRHLLGFCRGGSVLTLITRRPLALRNAGGWGNSTVTLPDGVWENALGEGLWEGSVRLEQLMRDRDQALLVRMD